MDGLAGNDEGAFRQLQEAEAGLKKGLSTRQISMIAIGGAIGTGLFLGSGLAISLAGPSVTISFAIGAVVALLLMGCLSEMTVAHPTTGSFGAYAHHYLGPWAGFAVHVMYWSAVVAATGTEGAGIAIYMGFWFPGVPGVAWVLGVAALLLAVNLFGVHTFGTVEYWLSFIKVAAIAVFLVLGTLVVFGGAGSAPDAGLDNFTVGGEFLPHGLWGMWSAVFVAIFSYLSIEMIAIAAGEARDPQVAVPRAMRMTVFRLIVFYVLTIALMLAIVPWTDAGSGESPFVKVFGVLGIPGGAHVMNAVVLVAAISAMNAQLYASTRMVFSLSRGGFAPVSMGALNGRGVPVKALLASSSGMLLAAVLVATTPETAYTLLLGIASAGALFTWFVIFASHLAFRRGWVRNDARTLAVRMPGYPLSTLLGAALVAAVALSTAFQPEFRITLYVGAPLLIVISIAYAIQRRRSRNGPAMTSAATVQSNLIEEG